VLAVFEFLAELILEIFGDIIFQVVFEVLMEFGFEPLSKLFHPGRKVHPLVAACGLILLGGAFGLGFALLVPHRLIPTAHLHGLSLVLAPLGAGLVMQVFGVWRRKRGGTPTCLATFWGGAAFAFGMALVRWLMVGHH
jgi:hypothetical protein